MTRLKVLFPLVQRDLKERYIGSQLGLFWLLGQQAAMILIMGFVLEKGLKVSPAGTLPFLAWLVPAQAAWFFFSESVATSVGVYIGFGYLVKKVPFRLSLLPLVKTVSALVAHLIFVALLIPVLLINGVQPCLYWLQALYYLVGAFFLVYGLSLLLSSVQVFVRDVAPLVGILLSLFMWITPIFWNPESLSSSYRWIAYLNPVAYITEGYRSSFLYGKGFWLQPEWSLGFWAGTSFVVALGLWVNKKLSPHFADVL